MLLKGLRALGVLTVGVVLVPQWVTGCGAKSGLRTLGSVADGGADAPVEGGPCIIDDDCAGFNRCFVSRCISGECTFSQPKQCDDQDVCTEDACDPDTGECTFRPLALDQDQDGFNGPRPGFAPGAPGSCGDDCDDTSPLAFPGAQEICDGVDNDCDGIVDNNARYAPAGPDSIRVSGTDQLQAGHGGIAFSGSIYAASYAGQKDAWRTYVKGLNPDGSTAFGDEPITNVPSDTFTGPIVWTGGMFGTAWEDRRDNDYEIYFNRMDPDGKKLAADLRVTNADGFSLHPHVVWNGAEFLLVWDDRRNGPSDFRIYGQRISVDGKLIGQNVQLSNPNWNAELPVIAEGEKTVGLAFNMSGADATGFVRKIGFRLLEPDLSQPKPLITLTEDDGINPSLVWNRDRFVVVYGKRDTLPGDAIWGAAVDESGNVLIKEKKLTNGASFARTQAILPLGDRLLLVWADDFDGNYEIYTQMFSADLDPIAARQRVTSNPSESVGPSIAFGPEGDVGVLFDDRRSGSWQVYFSRLVCVAGN
ncbi:MAG: putative metal-binding motif-containing protein [Polyangiaceae bacterium]